MLIRYTLFNQREIYFIDPKLDSNVQYSKYTLLRNMVKYSYIYNKYHVSIKEQNYEQKKETTLILGHAFQNFIFEISVQMNTKNDNIKNEIRFHFFTRKNETPFFFNLLLQMYFSDAQCMSMIVRQSAITAPSPSHITEPFLNQ